MIAADDGMKYGTQQTSGIIYCGGLQIRPKNEKFHKKKRITICFYTVLGRNCSTDCSSLPFIRVIAFTIVT